MSAMPIADALHMAKHYRQFQLPELVKAQEVLEEAGETAAALSLEEYLIDQSDEAWEQAGIKPY